MATLDRASHLEAYPDDLIKKEREYVFGALDLAALPTADREALERRDFRVGIALSGGGIRSATFSLGVFQALAKRRLLRYLSYLSTVSGGGYFGSFFGALLQRDRKKLLGDKAGDAPYSTRGLVSILDAERILADSGSRPLRFLRNNGRYLAPAGSGDLLTGAAIVLRNWLSAHILIGVFSFFLLLLLTILRYALWPEMPSLLHLPQSWGQYLHLSPFVIPAAAVLLFAALPLAWGYWMTPELERERTLGRSIAWLLRWIAPVLIAAAAFALPRRWPEAFSLTGSLAIQGLGLIAVLTIAFYVLIRIFGSLGIEQRDDWIASVRNRFSVLLGVSMAAFLAILLMSLVDTLGLSTYAAVFDLWAVLTAAYGALLALVAIGRKLAVIFALRTELEKRPRVALAAFSHIAAFVILAALLVALSAVTHAVAWYGEQPYRPQGNTLPENWLVVAGAAAVFFGLLSFFMGHVWSFVNRSTLHPLYEARLRRAYLGASNPARVGRDDPSPPVTKVHKDDGIALADYHPEQTGGPIHLINVTVNQTVGSRTRVQHKDRKGMGMAVGPGGLSVGARHHALWTAEGPVPGLWDALKRRIPLLKSPPEQPADPGFHVFPGRCEPEELDLGHWVAISGAAFSTGLGYRTSLGLSLLAGLFNIRLGYWWNSGIDPARRSGVARPSGLQPLWSAIRMLFPGQLALLDEWLARFHGVAHPHWYLSDGGHYENLGAYELIRRQLPFIIICDNEQDRLYTFDGLANLVRKARSDFGARIEFLSAEALQKAITDDGLRRWFGPLAHLRRGSWDVEPVEDPVTCERRVTLAEVGIERFSLAYAALAEITYPDAPKGMLLYIKPTIVGAEPADVLHYHSEHADFPHEPTIDQFFDEAQWESYRTLGEHIADLLFDDTVVSGWTPHRAVVGDA
ncbi:MAG: hypothetical protein AMS25_08595 [Gemmatimonas sp. SM23_52]|nr:MAG: hypothetical protein AMS25_08595 [Gemmatimonas sp. SM23_52]